MDTRFGTITRWVPYHTGEWEVLVEMGWVTMDVLTGFKEPMAKMLWDGRKR